MKNVNNVNELNGKEWLKHSINFYEFDEFNVDEIQTEFLKYCYKKRTTGKIMLNDDEIICDEYDFTFKYVKNKDELRKLLKVIYNSSYNSYHIILLDDEVDNNGNLLSKNITNFIEKNNLEYRGKIVIYCKKNKEIKKAFMILNRNQLEENKLDYKNFKIEFDKQKEYVIYSQSKIDKIGLKHPAPYSYIDIEKIINTEKIKNKTILDPFLGVGSTIIGSYKNNKNIGIELNKEYVDLIQERIKYLKIDDLNEKEYRIIKGDCNKEIPKLKENVDIVITSPPYFNILKNKNKGIRHDKSQTRQGIEYYSDSDKDLGNIESYTLYLKTMTNIFKKIYKKMNKNGKFYLIISDFTIDKKETDIHSDMILCMNKAGFKYNGTSFLLQNQKSIYPFGYPYKIVLNHIFQYVIIFEKEEFNGQVNK